MTMTHESRTAELAARFAATKDFVRQVAADKADERKQIVAEMLTYLSRGEVADVLGVTRTRVGQLASGE